jgi:3-methyladenine DNA glycosylase AlkD
VHIRFLLKHFAPRSKLILKVTKPRLRKLKMQAWRQEVNNRDKWESVVEAANVLRGPQSQEVSTLIL